LLPGIIIACHRFRQGNFFADELSNFFSRKQRREDLLGFYHRRLFRAFQKLIVLFMLWQRFRAPGVLIDGSVIRFESRAVELVTENQNQLDEENSHSQVLQN
jgi:hypothetical protein